MPNIKILVCAHKKDFVKSDDVYMPIHAGKAISDIDLGFQGDDTGDNISHKNRNYCEVTALYWAWKNLKNIDYIGLNHYRRYFKFSNPPFAPPYTTYSVDRFLKMDNHTFHLDRHLGKYDIILAKPLIFSYSISTQYAVWCNSEDFRLLKKIVNDLFPDYYYSFCNIMEHNNKGSLYNMFITRWEIFDDYCKWLFAVLEEVEKSVHIENYSVFQARIFGIMAERLLYLYVRKNKLKVKYYPIIHLGDDSSGYMNYSTIRNIIHYLKCDLSFMISRSWEWWLKDIFKIGQRNM
jgi:hypothetical protein